MPACPQCGQTFARPFTLRRHLNSSHGVGGSTAQHQCSKCDKDFSRHDLLERHRLNHHGAGRVACAICSHTFRRDYLKQHQQGCCNRRRHPGEVVFRNQASKHTGPQCLNDVSLEQSKSSWQTSLDPIWRTDDNVEVDDALDKDVSDSTGQSKKGQGAIQQDSVPLAAMYQDSIPVKHTSVVDELHIINPTSLTDADCEYHHISRVYVRYWTGGLPKPVSVS